MSESESAPTPIPGQPAKEVQIIGAGTVIWVVAGLVIALSGATADQLWTCAVGVLLGLNGVRIAIKRKRRLAADQLSN